MGRHRPKSLAFALAIILPGTLPSLSQGVDVSSNVVQEHSPADQSPHRSATKPAEVVVWLSPLQPLPRHSADTSHSAPFRLVQKNKQFSPHLLVVPTGTSVEFPNKDPFLHNVFSLFNGRRFDLGLYESGSTRSVSFDREGVSYIFCNIHPEMGAVVLALSTPYFAVSTPSGSISLHDVPPGTYRLHVWSETYEPADANLANATVQVGTSPLQLATIILRPAADPARQHKNKFGQDYLPTHEHPY